MHKYPERNNKATALIERSPHCTIRRTVSCRGANEHAGNRDSGIDSQHPCTYERVGPPIGKVPRPRNQALSRQRKLSSRSFSGDLRSVKSTSRREKTERYARVHVLRVNARSPARAARTNLFYSRSSTNQRGPPVTSVLCWQPWDGERRLRAQPVSLPLYHGVRLFEIVCRGWFA